MSFHTVVSTIVKSDIKKAWPVLWSKAYNTKEFIPALEKLEIHEKTDDYVLRTMVLGGTVIKERIIGDEYSHTIYFHNIEGSDVKGLIYNKLYINGSGDLVLEFGSNASSKGELMPNATMFQGTVNKTKEIIEKLA